MYALDRMPRFTPQQYLAFEADAETRHEYYDGYIVAMAGGTLDHSAITMNVGVALSNQLRGGPCRVLSNDMRVSAGPNYYYPDVSAVCGKPVVVSNTLQNPALIVEVLSPSTASDDRTVKWTGYKAIESLQAYLLVSQDSFEVEMYVRQPDGDWQQSVTTGLDATLILAMPACTLSLADLYDGVEFETDGQGE